MAEIEHVEGVKWTGVSVFRLAAAEPKVVRTGKGRVTGTGCSKLDAHPPWPRDVDHVAPTKTGKLVLG